MTPSRAMMACCLVASTFIFTGLPRFIFGRSALYTFPSWMSLDRCSIPLPPPSPSDDLRPPPSYRCRGVAVGCQSEKRKAGQGGSGKPLRQVLAVECRAMLHILSAVVETTKDTDTIAGLQILCIINEPKAAAITYGLDKKSRRTEHRERASSGAFCEKETLATEGKVRVYEAGMTKAARQNYHRFLYTRARIRVTTHHVYRTEAAYRGISSILKPSNPLIAVPIVSSPSHITVAVANISLSPLHRVTVAALIGFYDPSGGLVASVLLPLSRTRKCETKYSTTARVSGVPGWQQRHPHRRRGWDVMQSASERRRQQTQQIGKRAKSYSIPHGSPTTPLPPETYYRKPASVSKPTSATETETETEHAYPFLSLTSQDTFAPPSSSALSEIATCSIIPARNPSRYTSVSAALPLVCPPVCVVPIVRNNIILEKHVGVWFILDEWTTTLEVPATYCVSVGYMYSNQNLQLPVCKYKKVHAPTRLPINAYDPKWLEGRESLYAKHVLCPNMEPYNFGHPSDGLTTVLSNIKPDVAKPDPAWIKSSLALNLA
ncbi:hypothetical protein EDB85DRAFT_1900449 [Lactarius pseudohatsudake]|nr:hypothetical protein EDB85DRAFT_1900449 [Lactarius pseudohatsudake]